METFLRGKVLLCEHTAVKLVSHLNDSYFFPVVNTVQFPTLGASGCKFVGPKRPLYQMNSPSICKRMFFFSFVDTILSMLQANV